MGIEHIYDGNGNDTKIIKIMPLPSKHEVFLLLIMLRINILKTVGYFQFSFFDLKPVPVFTNRLILLFQKLQKCYCGNVM